MEQFLSLSLGIAFGLVGLIGITKDFIKRKW